jgi:hypothetical protein
MIENEPTHKPRRLPRDPRRWTEQYPIDQMKPGNTMFIPTGTGPGEIKSSTVTVHVSRLARSYEPRKHFTCERAERNGVQGIIVWRQE